MSVAEETSGDPTPVVGNEVEPDLSPRARRAWRRIVWVQVVLWSLVLALILYVAVTGLAGIGPYAPRHFP